MALLATPNRMFALDPLGMFEGASAGTYAVDVREDGDRFYVEAELPGFKRESVEINLENQTLRITAERQLVKDQDADGLLLHERSITRFDRSFRLPPTVDGNGVIAKLEDGVLTVTINKREDSKPRKITVS